MVLFSEPQMWTFHVVVWQFTSKQNIKPCAARASRTCSKIIFLHSTNQIIDFWRCCCRFGRHFLNFLLTCSDTTTFLENLAAKWLWYQVFSRQNDAGLGALSVALWQNLVLSVVLHLESKALYLRAFLYRESQTNLNCERRKNRLCLALFPREEWLFEKIMSLRNHRQHSS